jgi:hypothetical protein
VPKLQLKKESKQPEERILNTQVLSGSLSGERLGIEIQDLEKRGSINHIVAFHGYFSWGGGREIIAYFAWLLRVFKWCKKKCRHYSTCPRYRGGTMPFLTRASSHSVPGRVRYDKST